MSLLPARLYPGMQCTSTLVPWSTGSEVFVSRLKISAGSSVHLSGNYVSRRSGFALLFSILLEWDINFFDESEQAARPNIPAVHVDC